MLQILLVSTVAVVAATAVTLAYFYTSYSRIVDERLAAGYLTSRAGLYAAPRVLRKGQTLKRERLLEALGRAGYVASEASDVWSGSFSAEPEQIVIRPRRGAHASDSPAFAEVRVGFDGRNRITEITGDGLSLESYALEPETLTNDAAVKTGQRAALAYTDLPPVLVHAILSIEDRRFFEHHGLDGQALLRALRSWVGGASEAAGAEPLRQGGSTITQQLVKNTYLTPERTLRRKFNEAVLASVLERRLSKQDIFALYCNEIYLGQRGAIAVRGVGQAARLFFGKDLNSLTLAEAATIAGMIQSPARYAPDRHAESALVRRNTVIAAMMEEGYVARSEAEAAMREPLAVVPVEPTDATAPYFIDYVNRVVESEFETAGVQEEKRDESGLRVYTTIDLELQQLAEQAVARQLENLSKVYRGQRRPQAALVALDPHTGRVLAMVGGASYRESQLNRATDARRQPGSVFKPFVYAAALESGISPVSLHEDAPRAFEYDRHATYRPENYGRAYSMRQVTMRDALVRSLNVVAVDLAMQAGLSRVAHLAKSFGLPEPEPYPSLALGTTEATPLEIASAYAALANGGRRVRPVVFTQAVGADGGAALSERETPAEQLIKPSTAYMLTDMLTGVVNEGTARAARGAIKGAAVAGKTGTSRDGWFAGYTPNLVCVVWIGFDDNKELGLTGADAALPAWVEFVRGALELRPELGGANFPRPAGVTTVEVDPATGLLASASCPQRELVAVTQALAPVSECYAHGQAFPLIASSAFVGEAPDVSSTSTSSTQQGATTLAPQETPQRLDAPATTHLTRRIPPTLHTTADGDTPEPLPPSSTQIETNREGRLRLTNELRVVALPESRQR